jgi:hypothetical protein
VSIKQTTALLPLPPSSAFNVIILASAR